VSSAFSGPGSPSEARFVGASGYLFRRAVALYGGAPDDDRVRLRCEWLEFSGSGVRLRGRGLLERFLPVRDFRYEQIADLAVLLAGRGARCRGVRFRAATESGCTYFFGKSQEIPDLVRQFQAHGILLKGQVSRVRIPYSMGYLYPESVLEPLPEG
jgi:hypothetical protein